eukprot:11342193-Alexandrium_andersonii.AAC.1
MRHCARQSGRSPVPVVRCATSAPEAMGPAGSRARGGERAGAPAPAPPPQGREAHQDCPARGRAFGEAPAAGPTAHPG